MTSLQLMDSLFVGFDNAFSTIDKTVRFPPYNLLKLSDTSYSIELAVAGYRKDEISITVSENNLEVSASKVNDTRSDYLYKGISSRAFTRTFAIAKGIEVKEAKYEDGILTILLEQKPPKADTVTRIQIS